MTLSLSSNLKPKINTCTLNIYQSGISHIMRYHFECKTISGGNTKHAKPFVSI